MKRPIHIHARRPRDRLTGWQPVGLAAFLALCLPGVAAGHADDRLVCEPQGFRMTRGVVNGADVAAGYRYSLTGVLQVPTPGFRHALVADAGRPESDPLVLHLRLVLTPPDGMTVQVISDLSIDAAVEADRADVERVVVTVDKPFGWGPERILCVVPFE